MGLINISDTLNCTAAHGKLVDAGQVKDSTKTQHTINTELTTDVSSLKNRCNTIESNITSLQNSVGGITGSGGTGNPNLSGLQASINNINNELSSVKDSVLTDSQKRLLELLNSVFNITKNDDDSYTVSLKNNSDFSFDSATLNDFMSLVETSKTDSGDEIVQIRLSEDVAGLWLSKDVNGDTNTKLWSNGNVEIIVGETNNDLILKKGEDGAPMKVMAEITKLNNEIGTSGGNTTSLSSRVASLEKNVANKADSSVVNSIESAVDTHGSQIESLWSSIRSVLNFKGDANNNTITAINNETITGVKVGDCYRWSLDTTATIAPHNATNSYAVVEQDDVMVCVSVKASHISSGGQCTTWLIVQANLSSEQLKIQIDNALDGIQNAYEYWVTQQEEGADTSKDAFLDWMKKPSIDAATQANNALDQLNNKNWADVTKEEYDAMDANTNKNENGVWTPKNPDLPWLNKDVKYIITDYSKEESIVDIINRMLIPISKEDYDNLEEVTPGAFYFIQ